MVMFLSPKAGTCHVILGLGPLGCDWSTYDQLVHMIA
jgi:hypothetical protein